MGEYDKWRQKPGDPETSVTYDVINHRKRDVADIPVHGGLHEARRRPCIGWRAYLYNGKGKEPDEEYGQTRDERKVYLKGFPERRIRELDEQERWHAHIESQPIGLPYKGTREKPESFDSRTQEYYEKDRHYI